MDRMGRLIDNMLKLRRIEAGNVDIEWQPVDVGTLITRAARVIEPQAAAKHIGIETAVPPFGQQVIQPDNFIGRAHLGQHQRGRWRGRGEYRLHVREAE